MEPRYVTLEEACEILKDERFANWQIPSWQDDAIGGLGHEAIIVIGMTRAEAYTALRPIMVEGVKDAMRAFDGA